MSIWRSPRTPAELQSFSKDTLVTHLGIEVTEIGPDYVRATMPVAAHTQQPGRLLHGGASLALAETLGSLGAMMCIEAGNTVLGQEINANHLRAVAGGLVTATARPLHVGRRSQVWQIEIHDDAQHLVCVSRLTLAVVASAAPR